MRKNKHANTIINLNVKFQEHKMNTKKFDQEKFNDFVLNNKIISFNEKPFRLTSGGISNMYINWRLNDTFLMDQLKDYIILFTESLELNPDCFYGVPDGATKLGIITQLEWARKSPNYGPGSHCLPMGRKTPKKNGNPKDKCYVGKPKGKTILLEDNITTASSLISSMDDVEKLKESNIIAVIALTNRIASKKGRNYFEKQLEKRNVSHYSLSDAITLIPRAYKATNPSHEIRESLIKEYSDFALKI
ncbi:MAG: hypothetical protein OQK82_06715 [Candidatus Pacearchaeota archaeon]|nr:hypothetical protein [Candidatus Pacearchaeota archaeon]